METSYTLASLMSFIYFLECLKLPVLFIFSLKVIVLLNLHPKLAIEKKLTSFSSKEQTGAKLDQCSKEELDEFNQLNFDYEKKFQFPFIIAVKGKNKNEILENFRSRINNDYVKEFQEAKKQVIKIALFRLNEILDTN